MYKVCCILAFAYLALFPVSEVVGQSLRPTEKVDQVTREIEMLLSKGILDTIPLGQSFGLTRTVRKVFDQVKTDSSSIYEKKLKELVQGKPFSAQLEMSFGWAELLPRYVQGNGLGYIDAVVSPLSQGRGGRGMDQGFNVVMEPSLGLSIGEWEFYKVLSIPIARGKSSVHSFGIQELWGEGPIGPLYLSVGRSPLVWGPSVKGSSLFSGQARSLDQISLGSDDTFRLPWILNRLGPARLSISLSRLENNRDIPHSYLVGYRLNIKPWKSLEMGLSALVHSGGDGSPSASLRSRILDHLIVVEPLTKLGTPGRQKLAISNRFAGFDIRWRLPWAKAPQIYASLVFDDLGKFNQLGRVFGQDASYVTGVFLPQPFGNPQSSVRLEYREAGIRFYQHNPFSSGLTIDGIIIGDNLGPNGRGGYLEFDTMTKLAGRLKLELAWEERSDDQYVVREGFVFENILNKPEEIRVRLVGSWEENWELGLLTLARVGYEKVDNYGALQGMDRSNWLFELRTILPLSF